MKATRYRQDRARWFRVYKSLTRLKHKKPTWIYLGEKVTSNSVILANHAGTFSPLAYENYAEFPLRLWGTYQMNSGLRMTYKYLSVTYYYEKLHWNKFLAKLFSLIAAPLATLFYKGLRLIPTYQDARLVGTMKESIKVLKTGTNLVIFPEDSHDGYHDVLTHFFSGFLTLGKYAYKNGIDIKYYPSYSKSKDNVIIIDKPILYSEILKLNKSNEEIASFFLDKCNSLRNFDHRSYLAK